MPYPLRRSFQEICYGGNGKSRLYQLAYEYGSCHTDILILRLSEQFFPCHLTDGTYVALAAFQNYRYYPVEYKILFIHTFKI